MEEEKLRLIIQEKLKESKLEDIGYVSGGLYYLGNGCYTGEGGWKEFKKELKKQIKEDYGKAKRRK